MSPYSPPYSLGSSLIIFSSFFIFLFLGQKLIEINNGQPIPLMWYIFILLFFGILALGNIAKILTTGHRLPSIHCVEEVLRHDRTECVCNDCLKKVD